MPLVKETIEIRAEPSVIFPIVSNYESYPYFMDNVKEVNILERGSGYELAEFVCDVDGRVIKWVEKNLYKPEENRVDFEQVKGDLKIMHGYWQLDKNGASTNVEFSIYFEFGIPMIAPLIHPLLAKKLRENMKQMLTDLKKRAEEI